ncbi:MAG: MBL fold metallo-hydrolase [Clostridiales bacterium]|jgi:flavorubredoxin|nr:MBL fold metallo-hydrolase [Clostridiales bacterium]
MHEIAKNIYWNGIKHWTLRNFHGRELSTHRASTYNAYIVRDEKTALIDTVWDPFADEFAASLEAGVGAKNIDLIVINHNEPDHGGSLGRVMELVPEGTPIYCSKNGAESIRKYFHRDDWNINVVKTGDSVSLGGRELTFVEMRLIHWPDSMMTFDSGAGVLFSNDAFGQHYCASGFFNDEVDECELYQEAIKYFANILAPYAPLIEKKLDEITALGLPVKLIAPSHGVIWRRDPLQIVGKYAEWAKAYSEGFAVIAYDCLYNATPAMAAAIAQGLANRGAAYKIFNTGGTDMSDLMTDMFCARGIIVGSSTVNNTVHRSIAGLLDDIRGHRLRGKIGAAFGSYGWSGEAPRLISEHLKGSGIEVAEEPLRAQYAPTPDDLRKCVEFGERFAEAMAAKRA